MSAKHRPSYPRAALFNKFKFRSARGRVDGHYHDTADISDYGLRHQHIRARPNVPFSEPRAFEPEGPLIVLIVRVVLHRSAGLCLWCFSCCCQACLSPDLLPGLASERGSHAGGGENGPLPGSRTAAQAGTSCPPKRLRWILLEIMPIRNDVGRHGSQLAIIHFMLGTSSHARNFIADINAAVVPAEKPADHRWFLVAGVTA